MFGWLLEEGGGGGVGLVDGYLKTYNWPFYKCSIRQTFFVIFYT